MERRATARKNTETRRLDVDLAMRIASEHLAYRSSIDEMERDLGHVRAEGGSVAGLVELLRSFQSQVRGHFALEERGGLFAAYRGRAPELQHRAGRMLAQHRELLERLQAGLDALRRLERAEGPGLEPCARELERLFADLRAHELAEDELLERLVDQDIRQAT